MTNFTFYRNRLLSSAIAICSLVTATAQTPTISAVSANHGCANTDTVIISGTHFTGVTAVHIGDSAVASYAVDDTTQITAVVGNAVTGVISVTTADGIAVDTTVFTVEAIPALGYYDVSIAGQGCIPFNAYFDVDLAGDWTVTSLTGHVNIINSDSFSVQLRPDTAGTFTVSYISAPNSAGCLVRKDTTVTTNPRPALPSVLIGDTICTGATSSGLIAVSPDTVLWRAGNGSTTIIGNGDTLNPVGLAGSGVANTNTAGVYNFFVTTKSANGCVSLGRDTVTLYIESSTFSPVVSGTSVCDGDSVILNIAQTSFLVEWRDENDNVLTSGTTFNAGILHSDSSFIVIYNSLHGCGSDTENVAVTVNHATSFANNVSVGLGCTYQIGSHTYSTAGTYHDTIANVNGCDSIVTTVLTINLPVPHTNPVTICGGSYQIGSHNYTSSGTYFDTIPNANGCDSVVKTVLTVRQATSKTQTFALCPGQSVTVGINTYTATGTYHDVLLNAQGCDSNVTTVINATTIVRTIAVNGFTATALDASATYQWKNCTTGELIDGATEAVFTADVAGTYQVILSRGVCTDSSICILLDTATSGIENINKDAVSVYPNPFTDKLTITPAVPYTLFDVLGRAVYYSEDRKNTLNALPVGTYILKTSFGSMRVVKM